MTSAAARKVARVKATDTRSSTMLVDLAVPAIERRERTLARRAA